MGKLPEGIRLKVSGPVGLKVISVIQMDFMTDTPYLISQMLFLELDSSVL
jgi:hypothetical protein